VTSWRLICSAITVSHGFSRKLVVVTDRLQRKPLLPLPSNDKQFMVWYVATHPGYWWKGCGRHVMSLSE
jgi:hypothetical protein